VQINQAIDALNGNSRLYTDRFEMCSVVATACARIYSLVTVFLFVCLSVTVSMF